MSFGIPVSRDTVFFVTPRVQSPRRCDNSRMSASASDGRYGQAHKTLNAAGRGMARLVPGPQLAVHAPAPGEKIAVGSDRGGVVRSASNLGYDLSRERLGDTGHILPTVVSMTEAAIVSSAPSVHLSVGGQDDGVT